ncbi:EamA family transporter [Cohnella panacarvi]|uniref:EamA family transporter n=1 Tax=Cohnella panacarvi TaxID=400776 RepID=UPI00047E409D|nr:DMT family transporter [Cohnella panacarvi]
MNRTYMWAVVLVLIGASSYGFSSSIFKLANEDGWSSAHLTFTQVLAGTAMLWLVTGVRFLRRRKAASSAYAGVRRSWLKLTLIGIVGLAMTTMLYNEALARIDASLAIVLLFQFTWITILLESIRKRAWPKKPEWLAMLFIAAGTVLAVGLLEHDLSGLDRAGVAFGLLSAVTYSLFFFLTDFLPPELDSISKSTVMSTASFTFVALLHFPIDFAWGDGGSIIGWGLLLGLLNTAVPFICFNAGIPKLGGGLAALLGSMELPAAVITAFLLLGEPLTWWQAAGVALILIGLWAAQNRTNEVVKAGREGED